MLTEPQHIALKLLGFEHYPIGASEYIAHPQTGYIVGYKAESKWYLFKTVPFSMPAHAQQAIELLNESDYHPKSSA